MDQIEDEIPFARPRIGVGRPAKSMSSACGGKRARGGERSSRGEWSKRLNLEPPLEADSERD